MPADIRVEEIADPEITAPAHAVIRLTAACVRGSDQWPHRGVETVALSGEELFFSQVHRHGGPAPVRRFLPEPPLGAPQA